jgi:dipeptidyl aminopeptidase/acylaminoacyl peptidase
MIILISKCLSGGNHKNLPLPFPASNQFSGVKNMPTRESKELSKTSRKPKKTSVRKRHLIFEDMMAIHRVSSPAVSPDGKDVAFVTTKHDHVENTTRNTIHLLDLETRKSKIITPGPGSHANPVFSPNGRYLAFTSSRDEKEGTQLWIMPLKRPGEAWQLTKGHGGVSQITWAPDSRRIAFARSVIVSPHFDQNSFDRKNPGEKPENADIYGLPNPKSTARIEDDLLFRHWDHWRDRKRSHVFLIDLKTGKMNDLTPWDIDTPHLSLGGSQDIAFAPDGREIAIVFNPDQELARSTNLSIHTIPLRGIRATGEPRNISNTEASDTSPRYSPDGRYILYTGMKRPKYEADRMRLKLYHRDSGRTRTLTKSFDRSPVDPQFSEDGKHILFLSAHRMRTTLFRYAMGSGLIDQLTEGTHNAAFRLIPGSDDVIMQRNSTTEADDLYLLHPRGIEPILANGPAPDTTPVDAGSFSERLTQFGDLPMDVKMHPVEEFWYTGAKGTQVHGAIIKPPKFRKGGKYPMLYIVHGGPQGMFADTFHYRWNFQMFASEGYVVVFTNPRGSTGYGQEFTDGVTRDWGGKAYEDLMKGLDFVLNEYDYIDPDRIGAAGASFGGFMMNWFEGHTDRFKALVSHDGIFQGETMAYTTEELWFEEWEHGKLPASPKELTRWSPHKHIKEFKTPMLLIHGELDFRCPISEGLGMFTALQIMNVPSRILFFPDEGHWVLKPANSQVWYRTIQDWFNEWLKK